MKKYTGSALSWSTFLPGAGRCNDAKKQDIEHLKWLYQRNLTDPEKPKFWPVYNDPQERGPGEHDQDGWTDEKYKFRKRYVTSLRKSWSEG